MDDLEGTGVVKMGDERTVGREEVGGGEGKEGEEEKM
jgi:hypothetical protein